MIRVTSPGKMVLLGEYAVLFGSPAVVVAVDRRAAVELKPSPQWLVTAPEFVAGEAGFEVSSEGRLRWRDDESGNRFRLVDRVLTGLRSRSLIDLGTPGALTLDTREFFLAGGRDKLGLGSSAALSVALATAVAVREGEAEGLGTSERSLRVLIDLHREIQGGRGSGVDVAASLMGGVIRFQIDDASQPTAAPLTLPQDLRLKAFWTGVSASTGAFLQTLERRRDEDPSEVDEALETLDHCSRKGADALTGGTTPGFLGAVDDFWRGLESLGRAIGMPILSDSHKELRRVAAECGVSYKPSGAGGGDVGIAFSSDPEALARMGSAAEESGFAPLNLEIDARGVATEDR